MKWTAPFKPLMRLRMEDYSRLLPIRLKDFKEGTCGFCSRAKGDCCYNCEKPICPVHSRIFAFILPPTGRPIVVLAVCLDCVKDNCLDELPLSLPLEEAR